MIVKERVAELPKLESPKLESPKLGESDSRDIAARCPATKPRIQVKCKDTKRVLPGLRVTLAGDDLGPTKDDGVTLPLDAGMAPGTDVMPMLALTPDQALRYEDTFEAPSTITYAKGCSDTFTMYVVCLARPRVKIVFKGGNDGVPGIAVNLAGKSLGNTNDKGIVEWPANEKGLVPKTYPLTLAFGGTDARKYGWVDPSVAKADVTVTDVDGLEFLYEVQKLGRPRIEIVREDNGAVVPNVGVKLSAGGTVFDFGKTGNHGLALRKDDDDWLEPKEYTVDYELSERDADRYGLAGPAPHKLTVSAGAEDKVTFKLKPRAALLIEVFRCDGEELPSRVKLKVEKDGSSVSQDHTTLKFEGKDSDLGSAQIKEDRVRVRDLEPGEYTVTVENPAGLCNAQKKSTEVWSLGVANGVAKVTLTAEQLTRVRIPLTMRQRIQFVAFDILPSTKKSGFFMRKDVYLGDDNASVDMGARCIILKNAIKKAQAASKIEKAKDVLKVFMAPEFFFRGTEGAYPIDKMSHIMDEMRKETSKADYADWLFVFGTAIGYLKHEGGSSKKPRKHKLKVAAAANTDNFKVSSPDVGLFERNVCARIPQNWDPKTSPQKPDYLWILKQGKTEAYVIRSVAEGAGHRLTLDQKVTFVAGEIDLLEPVATEVFNVALVQKGGPGTNTAGLREAIVYKEEISAIDYLGEMFGKHDDFHKPSGDGRKVEVHGAKRRVLPTEGAHGVLGGNPNVSGEKGVSEGTAQGLGGGSIFTMDGITFGLEVCRDHLKSRLKNYFVSDPSAKPPIVKAARTGEPKIQVQLIPSWGAFIDPEAIVGVNDVLVFNVDGPEGPKAGVLGGAPGYHCPVHGGTQPAPYQCTAGPHYKCNGYRESPSDIACLHCGKMMTRYLDKYSCTSPHFYPPATMTCPVSTCAAATKPALRCAGCGEFRISGPGCGSCGSTVTNPARYCDTTDHAFLSTSTTKCSCGSDGVLQADRGYVCQSHAYVQGTPGACAKCGTGLLDLASYYPPAKDITSSASLETIAVDDASGDYSVVTAKPDQRDPSAKPGDAIKKTTYTTTTKTVTPRQTKYFDANGTVAVFPVMPLPPPESV